MQMKPDLVCEDATQLAIPDADLDFVFEPPAGTHPDPGPRCAVVARAQGGRLSGSVPAACATCIRASASRVPTRTTSTTLSQPTSST